MLKTIYLSNFYNLSKKKKKKEARKQVVIFAKFQQITNLQCFYPVKKSGWIRTTILSKARLGMSALPF
jgi:hypothetical protein